jgi:adenylate cyclase
MMDIIFRYNGTLDKIVGDELMVVYGAPLEKTDDSDRAILTAIDMMKKLKALNEERKKNNLKQIDIGIGLNSGEVVSGNIGSETQMDYTVIGDTVNLGARLCSAAKAYEIIISEYTANEVTQKFNLEKMEPIMVKGKEKPINIFKVNY